MLDTHEKLFLGMILMLAGFGICGRFLGIFTTPLWSGIPQVDEMLSSFFSVPLGPFTFNAADFIEFFGLLIFLLAVREF